MTQTFRVAVASVDRTKPVEGSLSAIEEAAAYKPDLLVLPEETDVIAQMTPYQYTLEEHPVFQRLRNAVVKFEVPIVSTLSAVQDGYAANMGFLLDRRGDIVGTYSKKHPAPSEEIITEAPITSDPFPVFDLEGLKVAIAICMDIHFPEMFRIYGLKGAHVACISTMYSDYTGDMLESLEKARAIDSGMYVAMSRYIQLPFLVGKSPGYAKVIAPDGRILASTAHKTGIAFCDIDPDWSMPFWGEPGPLLDEYPNLRIMFDKIRRPELYGELVKPKKAE